MKTLLLPLLICRAFNRSTSRTFGGKQNRSVHGVAILYWQRQIEVFKKLNTILKKKASLLF